MPSVFRIGPNRRFRNHVHPGPHLMAVLEGQLCEQTAKSTVELKAGDARISPAMGHSLDFGPNGACCLMMDVDPPTERALVGSLFFHDDERIARLATALARAATGEPAARNDPGRPLRVEALEAELLAQVERRRGGRVMPPPPWPERIRELLHDEPASLRVGELAARVGVHRVHLARAFRDHFGTSVTAYARRLRVHQALRLIERTAMPLSQIAAEAGFSDQAHLTREIRAALGTTPGRLRAELRPALHSFKTGQGAGVYASRARFEERRCHRHFWPSCWACWRRHRRPSPPRSR